MSIIAESPLADVQTEIPVEIALGDGSAGAVWDIPPGSMLPPGLRLNHLNGKVYGKPTIPGNYNFYIRERYPLTGAVSYKEFALTVNNTGGTNTATIRDLITQAFLGGKILPGQKFWFDEETDEQGRIVFSIKVNHNGTERKVAFIAVVQ